MSEETHITPLSPETVDRIAAGEVVERPASVVKELVENSLDADASRVDVDVAGAGVDRVAVSDDGHGMSEADVRAAVKRHTTSKLRDSAELDGGVTTLGFRGEALHTIGAVARLTVTTRGADADAAVRLRMEGGEVASVDPAGRGRGTTVEVEDLFYNTPARREYLKSEATEFGRVNRVVTRYALANPDVAVSLTHDGNEVFATTGSGDLAGAVMAVYGREVAASMTAVDAAPSGPVDRVHGLVSDPETTRSTRAYLSTFVNGRYVESSALRESVLEAYGGQLAADRFPFAVLFVEMDAGAVDPNVHPRKLEVRFDDEASVREAVTDAVRDALLDAGLVRTRAPRGRSAPDDAAVSPGDADTTDAPRSGPPDRPETAASGFDVDDGATDEDADRSTGTDTAGADDSETDADATTATTDATDVAARPARDPPSQSGDDGADETPSTTDDGGGDQRRLSDTSALSLSGDAARQPDLDSLPAMRVLGQFRDTYVVAESDDGLLLVDQHAADERVNYERLCRRLADDPASQSLVSPVSVELTAGEAAAFRGAADAVRSVGFEASLDGDRTLRVTGVPAVLSDALDPALVRDVLETFLADAAGDPEDAVAAAADDLLADMACYPSVTGNTSLSEGSVVALLEALDECENPYACPHGRPVVVELSADELADRFERDYPGHAVRRPES